MISRKKTQNHQKSFQRPSLPGHRTGTLCSWWLRAVSKAEQIFGCDGLLDFHLTLSTDLWWINEMIYSKMLGEEEKNNCFSCHNSSFPRKNIKLLNLLLNTLKTHFWMLQDLLIYSKMQKTSLFKISNARPSSPVTFQLNKGWIVFPDTVSWRHPFTLRHIMDENTSININSSLKREADLVTLSLGRLNWILTAKTVPVHISTNMKKP